MSAVLPWSIITLFTSYPPILNVTTRASSWGCMVPTLSSSEKPNTNGMHILALLGIELDSSAGQRDTDITLEGQEPVIPGAAKLTFIVQRGSLEEASPRSFEPAWPTRLLEWCKSCFNFLSWTNWSKWSYKFLQSLVMYPWSWWQWQ